MEHIASQVLYADVAVALTGSVESPVIDLHVGPQASPLTIWLKASSVSGVADVKLQAAASEDGTNFEDYADVPTLIDSTLLANPTAPEGWNTYTLTDVLNKFLKFKVTGIASNPADALVSAKLIWREFF